MTGEIPAKIGGCCDPIHALLERSLVTPDAVFGMN